MTWSIIARDPASGWFGIGIATRFFAVGALCPLAAPADALAACGWATIWAWALWAAASANISASKYRVIAVSFAIGGRCNF